ncbi:hypothetical protein Achl_4230 (plasmid) [Pseudarthrobacter chlorophenolicus A6]|uniref:Uncharacterized protein n=1 Tax=Pseudarthrobacter chlorophenolicus (strain ATCC 700700 / DSM 12829 / CIP 107037 / JCM 12360 / KCTC 9906 / NCIMB 13794 / A6) TaxID=452863 RepID=B8HID4_PSECP|nr:hypothetical protein [Pseudarthrobacter chlorophenolicus]ACL42181.1 hypothetical protein Achl_4230 [Pseudarthrobacter chlorophenolicus A6]SDQ14513.1 hypothetical protein SAMN04489738_0288 [Pseudarthrobacter chlorophenolicus]
MTELRYIETEEQWDALPVGTLARVGYLEHDDNGNEIDEGKKMTILRVEGDVRTNVGDYMLAGGKYWSEVWVWEQGAYAADTATIPDEDSEADVEPDVVDVVEGAIRRHEQRLKDIGNTPYSEYLKIPQELLPPKSPAHAVVEALGEIGWAPPVKYPEGVQVWTISGIPDGGRSDGTQAYLSLPDRTDEHRFEFQDRGDIWLDKPTVTVNFELPAREV